jgi:hypothetical protein
MREISQRGKNLTTMLKNMNLQIYNLYDYKVTLKLFSHIGLILRGLSTVIKQYRPKGRPSQINFARIKFNHFALTSLVFGGMWIVISRKTPKISPFRLRTNIEDKGVIRAACGCPNSLTHAQQIKPRILVEIPRYI